MIEPKVLFKDICLKVDGDKHICVNTFTEELPYYDGHFPSMPILPAVAQIDFSLQCIAKLLKRDNVTMKSISSGKFLAPIDPNIEICVTIQNIKENCYKVLWHYESKKITDLVIILD